MAKTWNPNAPAVLGLEWLVTGGADSGLQSGIVRDLLMESTQAETVTAFAMPIDDIGASNAPPSTILEVFDDGDQHQTGPHTLTVYAPNADVVAASNIGAGLWSTQPGSGTTNLWSFINRPVQYPMPDPFAESIAFMGGGPPNNRYVFQVASGAFPLTDRVLWMQFVAVFATFTFSGPLMDRQYAVRLRRISDGNIRYPVGGANIFAGPFSNFVSVALGEINPWTDRPWTPADVRAFDGGDYAIQIEAVGDSATAACVLAAQLQVDHMPENRLAVGMWRRPKTQFAGVVQTTSVITLPGAAANWSKPASGRHAYRWRIPNDYFVANPTTSSVQWRTAMQQLYSAAGENGPYDIDGEIVQLDGYAKTVATAPDTFAPALHFIVAGSPSSDSQPYYMIPEPSGRSLEVTSALSVEQGITPGSTQSYLGFRFLAWTDSTSEDDVLTLTVRRVSDNAQMGGSFSISAAEFAQRPMAFGGVTWRIVADFLSAATGSLVSGTAYTLRWSVTGSASWWVPLLNTGTGGNPSFGGSANCAQYRTEPGGVVTPRAWQDIPGVLLQQPPSIASAAAEVIATPTRRGINCFCNVDAIEHVLVSWVGVVVSAFATIEIERYVDSGSAADQWRQVAVKLSNPTTEDAKWVDREVPRGTPAKYRLRYTDTNGAFSEWRETPFVMPQARGCEVILTSNHVPDITVAYQHEPAVGYDPLGFSRDRLMAVDGADYQVAFVEREDRGIAETMTVIANFGQQPCDDLGRPLGKRAIFAPLMRAARAEGLPYVCVLDSDGNRTFAYVEFGRGQSVMPGWRYHIPMTTTPISVDPLPVIVP